jgi:hypothetical protein
MGELAAEIAALANRSFHDRDNPQAAAREVIAKSGSAAAELAWAILTAVAQTQTQPPPSHQIRRRLG